MSNHPFQNRPSKEACGSCPLLKETGKTFECLLPQITRLNRSIHTNIFTAPVELPSTCVQPLTTIHTIEASAAASATHDQVLVEANQQDKVIFTTASSLRYSSDLRQRDHHGLPSWWQKVHQRWDWKLSFFTRLIFEVYKKFWSRVAEREGLFHSLITPL